MKFDIKAHLQDHAYFFKQYQKINKDDLHFKFSILDLYFYANNYPIEHKLEEILNELLKPTIYTIKMKNGFYIDKNGNKKQKYANRNITIDLKPEIKALAIHIQGSKGEYTQPHFHFLLKKNARLGLNYSLLKHHISKVLEKHNLKAHFDEISDFKYKNLATSISKFFWQLKKLDNAKFKKYILNNEHVLKKYLDLLYEYAEKSNRLDYFFKTMKELHERLNKLKINFKYKNFNLKTSYPIDFILQNQNKENKEVIKLLNEKNYTQKELKKYIDNAILKDAVRYSLNKKNSYIVSEIKKHTTILNNFKSNKTLVNNYLKLLNKDLKTTKTKTQLKEENKLKYIKAFKNALKTAKNEKELREILNKKYDFKFKKRKGKVIGFSFNNTYLSIKDLNFKDISEIRAILINNNTPNTNTEEIKYKRIENEEKLQELSIRTIRIKREISRTEQTITRTKRNINETDTKITRTEQTFKERIKQLGERISNKITTIRKRVKQFGERIKSIINKKSNNSRSFGM